MFQMIQERKTAVGDLPNQTDTSQTEEDRYAGEWFCTRNLYCAIPFCLQFVQ